jgi:patatin-like phospholipase/acyl hydrolase
MILWRLILRRSYGKGGSELMDADGGGIRGMSELIILDETMHRVQRKGNLSTVPLPADYFDMICGTSTGG